jgi:methionyl-tRNA formyltransferase
MLQIVFMGSPAFAVPALQSLLAHHRVVLAVSQTDKPAGRGRAPASPPVVEVARAAEIPVVQPKSARTEEFRQALVATGADVAVVVAYGKILPRGVLDAFPLGCINIHGSLLPAYRGAAPIQWSIINGETETGITTMKLDEGMDTGPMLLRRAIPIDDDDTAQTLAGKLAPIGAELLIETLSLLEAGSLVETPQDDSLATYAPLLEKEDGIIDWRQPAVAVANRIRGVDPWPGAVTTAAGEPLKLFRPRALAGAGVPGEVIAVDERGVVVACGDRACAVAEVQPAGRKRMPARDWARGRNVTAGALFGGTLA